MPASQSRPRNRTETEARIISATGDVLLRDGFTGLNLKAVATEAGVDKVLIYRYFGRIDDLLTAFGRTSRFWPGVADVIDPDNDRLMPSCRLASFFDRLITELRARPLTVQILAMEAAAPNPLTARLDATREGWGRDVAQRLTAGSTFAEDEYARFNTAVTLLVAGIQYLLIRARNTGSFSGLAIARDETWDRIRRDLAWVSEALFAEADAAFQAATEGPPA